MHAHVESAKYGATALARGADANPRKMLLDIMEAHSDKSKNEIFEIFREVLSEEPAAQRAVEWYFFLHMYDYATDPRRTSACHDPVQRAEARVQQRERIEAIKAQIVMLDLTMPNGKALRDCTFQEVATLGNRFSKLATMGKKTELVGAKLNEEQVRAIMK